MTPLMLANLSVARPAALWGLLLLAVPLAIHLYRKRKQREVVRVVPTLTWALAAGLDGSTSVVRSEAVEGWELRQRGLLAVRMAVVAAAVLGAAGLGWQGSVSGGSTDGPQDVAVVLVDASASMGAIDAQSRTTLSRLIEPTLDQAGDWLEAGDARRVWVQPVGPTLSPQGMTGGWATTPAQLRAQLATVTVHRGEANWSAAVQRSVEALASVESSRASRVWAITDEQATGIEAMVAADWGQLFGDADESIRWLTPAMTEATPANAAVGRLRVRPSTVAAGDRVNVEGQVWNGSDATRELTARAVLDGRTLGRATVTVPAWSWRAVWFSGLPGVEVGSDSVRELSVRVELANGGGALREDDAASATITVAPARGVCVIDDHPQASYTRWAIDAVPGWRLVDAGDLSAALASAEVVWWSATRSATPEEVAAVTSWVEAGGTLVTQGASGLVPAANGRWEIGTFHLGWGDWADRLLVGFDRVGRRGLRDWAAKRRWVVEGQPAGRVMLRWRDGTPAVVVEPRGSGKVMLVGWEPSRDGGALGREGLWAAWVAAVLQWAGDEALGGSDATVSQVAAGEGDLRRLPASTVDQLTKRGDSRDDRAVAGNMADATKSTSTSAAWWWMLAGVLLLGEGVLRARGGGR